MTRPVSVVLPCLDDRDLLAACLPALMAELDLRALSDEVIVVDDTGEDALSGWLAESFPGVRCVTRAENGGFARALRTGVRAAKHPLVFCMNPDVIVRRGFLDPLVACLADPEVHSATPRVLLGGDPSKIESITELSFVAGMGRLRQRGLEDGAGSFTGTELPVAYAVGGTCLLRRDEFLAEGHDPLYEPFYMEDLDLGWAAWRRGQRVVYEPSSIVEHHHRGTIGKVVEREFAVATIERNTLLFQWKFLDEPELLREHLAALYRRAVDAWLEDDREELIWIALATRHVDEALAARAALDPPERSFREILAATDPGEGSGAHAPGRTPTLPPASPPAPPTPEA